VKNKVWRLGLPRALFYYYYAPWWETFWQALGVEVIVSPPTSKEIMDKGVSLAVAEACLPVKVYYGHAAWLAGQVDALFVPRLVSVQKKSFICPKLMGLPDMLRASLKPCPPIIDTVIDLSRRPEQGLKVAVKDMARAVGFKGKEVALAREAAIKRYQLWLTEQQRGLAAAINGNLSPGLNGVATTGFCTGESHRKTLQVGIVGHAYILYDRYLVMDIPGKVKRLGGQVILPENLAPDEVATACRQLPKRLFWTLGQKIMGSALNLMQQDSIAGIIHLTAFGCGPDSLVGDLAERYARRCGRPFLLLTLDEHTGEAGINTRLEAFMDMLARRCTA